MLALLVLAADEEPSKTAFYVAGCALVAWALIASFLGIRGMETWPPSKAARNGVIAISVVLVAAVMATAVITA